MNINRESRNNQYLLHRLHPVFLVLVPLVLFAATFLPTLFGSPSKSVDSIVKSNVSIMSKVTYQQVPSGRKDGRRFIAVSSSSPKDPVSIKSWMTLVASDSEQGFKAAIDLSDIISSSEYSAILFETMGTSWSTSDEVPFEFAMVNQPALKRFAEGSPDRYAFEEHFSKCLIEYNTNRKNTADNNNNTPTVCFFQNLGGDAHLVSPLPQKDVNDVHYSHLAAFVRNAPRKQVVEFWAMGASQYLNELKHGGGKKWFSTNGMGVAWLHLRLDTRPKYYSYDAFK